MNKKALLVVLPALLVLSACQIGPKSKDNNIFLEDTLAHEELFGGVDFCGVNTNIRKVDPVEHPDNDPTIGIQSQQEEGNKVSFRFVAAVSIAPENLESTVANWTRTVSDKDGNVLEIVPGQGTKYLEKPKYYLLTNFSPYKGDKELFGIAYGDGPIDASFKAIPNNSVFPL